MNEEFIKWWHSDEAQMDCQDDGHGCEKSHKAAFLAGVEAERKRCINIIGAASNVDETVTYGELLEAIERGDV